MLLSALVITQSQLTFYTHSPTCSDIYCCVLFLSMCQPTSCLCLHHRPFLTLITYSCVPELFAKFWGEAPLVCHKLPQVTQAIFINFAHFYCKSSAFLLMPLPLGRSGHTTRRFRLWTGLHQCRRCKQRGQQPPCYQLECDRNHICGHPNPCWLHSYHVFRERVRYVFKIKQNPPKFISPSAIRPDIF